MKSFMSWLPLLILVGELRAETLCPVALRTVRLEPSCVAQDKSSCRDLCESMTPDLAPSCFQNLDLSCPVVQLLKRPQATGSVPIIRLSELLAYYRLHPEDSFAGLFVLAQDLSARDFSPLNRLDQGSVPVTAENFKLGLRADVQTAVSLLNQYSLTKASTSAASWLQFVEASLLPELQRRLQNFPYLSISEKETLEAELQSRWTSAADRWKNLEQKFSTRTFVETRRQALNARLKNLQPQLAALDREVLILATQQLQAQGQAVCELSRPGSCELTSLDGYSDAQLPQLDQYLDTLEFLLQAVTQHAGVKAAETSLPVGDSGDLDYGSDPSLYAVDSFLQPLTLQKAFRTFVTKPEDDQFLRLKAAMAAGSYQEFFNADGIWSSAAANAGPALRSPAFLKADPQLKKLSCPTLRDNSVKAQLLQNQIDARKREMAALLNAQEGQLTAEHLRQLSVLMEAITQLANEKLALGTPNIVAMDRQLNFSWFLPRSATLGSRVALEFVEVDGVFWTPNIPLRLQDVLPSVNDVSSELGNMRSGGSTLLGPRGLVQLAVKAAPYDACAKDLTVRAIVKVERPEGSRRYRLEAVARAE